MAQPVHIRIVGAGPDRSHFEEMSRQAGESVRIEFLGAMPARDAFRLARVVVMPSWAESFPYVVLEAAAAGLPLIATRVGGIPEIFGPAASRLVMTSSLAEPDAMAVEAASLRLHVGEHFSVTQMVSRIDEFYAHLAARPRSSADAAAESRLAQGKAGLTGAEH